VRLRRPSLSTIQWIDTRLGFAYICVPVHLAAFADFLDGVDRLLADVNWRPGMPVVEDLRECEWVPPASAAQEWQVYLGDRRRLLNGCRWAVVSPHYAAIAVSLLDAAAAEADRYGIVLQRFTRMSDAHLWLGGAAGG
jgi:hypothetical protein